MHEICQIAFEAHHAACKQSSGSKLGHTPQSKTIIDEEAFFLLKIIGMKEKNTEAYSAKNGPEKRRVRVLSRVRVFPESWSVLADSGRKKKLANFLLQNLGQKGPVARDAIKKLL